MSEQKHPARPRQVTTAGVLGVAGSVLVVVSLFDSLSRLRSVETRDAVDQFLGEPPGDGLGVSTGWVIDALHGLVLFNGALAAIAAVLAVYVFQRHRAARIGFSIAAALLLLTSPFSGGALAMIVAFAAVMLWSRPARDWFAGREPAPLPAAGERPDAERPDRWAPPVPGAQHHAQPVAQSEGSDQPPSDQPEPSPYPYGQAPTPPSPEQPAPAGHPYGSRPPQQWAPPAHDQRPMTPTWAAGTAQDPDRRPVTVAFAAGLTWVFAGVTAFAFAIVVLMLVFGRDTLIEAVRNDQQLDQLGLSTNDLLAILWVMSAVILFWTVSAMVLAFLAFRRVGWARILLVVSAGFSLILSVMAFPVGIVHILAAGAVIVLLFTGGANDWYARRPRSFSPPPGPPGGPYGGAPYGGGPGPSYPGPQQPPAQQPPAQAPQPPQQPPGKPPVW